MATTDYLRELGSDQENCLQPQTDPGHRLLGEILHVIHILRCVAGQHLSMFLNVQVTHAYDPTDRMFQSRGAVAIGRHWIQLNKVYSCPDIPENLPQQRIHFHIHVIEVALESCRLTHRINREQCAPCTHHLLQARSGPQKIHRWVHWTAQIKLPLIFLTKLGHGHNDGHVKVVVHRQDGLVEELQDERLILWENVHPPRLLRLFFWMVGLSMSSTDRVIRRSPKLLYTALTNPMACAFTISWRLMESLQQTTGVLLGCHAKWL